MTDDDMLAAFEAGTLDADGFDHEAHVRLGWIYVSRLPLAAAIDRFTRHLKAWVSALGAADKYHETLTWAYLVLIAERQADTGATTFEDFIGANPDLVAKPSQLARLYQAETLASARARNHFVLPDRLAG